MKPSRAALHVLALSSSLAPGPSLAALLFQESFEGTATGASNFNGTSNGTYEQIASYAQEALLSNNVTNVAAGLNYGSIGNVGLAPSGNSVFNSTGTVSNKWRIEAPLTIAEASTVYFSALVTGDRRAHFGPFDFTGAFVDSDNSTSNWDKAIAIGFNTQQFTGPGAGIDPNSAGSLDAAWFPGPGDPLGTGFQDGGTASVPGGGTATRLIVGRIVNNPGPANDVIEFHSVFTNSPVFLPGAFPATDLDGAGDAARFYSKADYDFGGDLVFSDINFTLQNNSGIDEIRFGETYFDVTGAGNQIAYTQLQSDVRFDETSNFELVTLTLEDIVNLPPGANYEIGDDNNAAVTYVSPTTGAVLDPLDIEVEIDPSQGPVTFTVMIKDDEGDDLETLTYSVASVPAAPPVASTLFADNYDRMTTSPDPLDIDSDITGMSGTAFTPTVDEVYIESFQSSLQAPNEASIQISPFDTLQAATGAGVSGWGVDHNFVDPAIASDGGFSVAMDVLVIDSILSEGIDRYAGFGIGLDRDEVNAFNDEGFPANSGPRGSINPAPQMGRGSSDFYCSISIQDMVQIFADGVFVAEFPVDGDGQFGSGTFEPDGVRLRTDFALADPESFVAGSFVHYRTYVNDLFVTSGFFRLTRTGSNFVGFSARASGFTETDDLVIGTVDAVDFPYPGDPSVPDPQLGLENLAFEGGAAASTDFRLTEGGRGILYTIELTPDLTTRFGVTGNALGAYMPGGVPSGVTDLNGMLVIEDGPLPTELSTRGFAIGKAVHWPAPGL